MEAQRQDTETHCHCGAEYRGQEHCPWCYCEQYQTPQCRETYDGEE